MTDAEKYDRIVDVLLDAGVHGDRLSVAVARMLAVATELVDDEIEDTLAAWWSQFDETPMGLAFRRVLSGDQTGVREAARLAGINHSALIKAERRARSMLTLKSGNHPSDTMHPDETF